MQGPELAFSEEMHAKKYRGKGENFREAMNRIASALADDDRHYQALREILLGMRFMPAGRVQSAIGATRQVTPYNCFVSGTIEDSFVAGSGSIMERAKEAALTMRMGGGIGYDFSTLRPRGALIKKLQSQSSGPISFMEIFDAVCRCTASSGHRRGAQMGVLRIDHPDIEEFIRAKQNNTHLRGFNISVGVTDEFMHCLEQGTPFTLRWGGQEFAQVNAAALWETLMRSTWDWAEPGVLFIDTINKMNNLWYCEQIAATNPCGEQPLPPFGACLLGSFNIVKYMVQRQDGWIFDHGQFTQDIPHVVRAMDNVVDAAVYPMYEQEKEAKNKRRMGLGVTGMANAIEAMGPLYGSAAYLEAQKSILEHLRDDAYMASAKLAAEKGPFPLYDERYLQGKFIGRLPTAVRNKIQEHGIRNSHLTSIAPTGTISLCADNVSSGIEPVFAYDFERTVQEFGGARTETIQDYGVRVMGRRGKKSSDVSVREHLDVLAEAAYYVDSAVSKTCNVPGTVSWEDFKRIYLEAWERGVKGCTTFRTDGKRGGILVEKQEGERTAPKGEAEAVCKVDPVTGRKECD